MTTRKRSLLAGFGSVLGIGMLLFLQSTANFYPKGTAAFRSYCQEHKMDYGAYIWTRSGENLGYSFMDFTTKQGVEPPKFHVMIPWVDSPKVEPVSS